MEQKNRQISIQEYLSLGYVYLIFLGIIRDVIFYKFFGVNILSYSGVLDILLSPINILFRDLRVFLLIILVIGSILFFFQKFAPWWHEKNKAKAWYGKQKDIAKLDEYFAQKSNLEAMVVFVAFMLSSMYLGMGIGAGQKWKSRIAANDVTMNHKLFFTNGEEMKVRMIGQNSTYLFYLTEEDKEVSIVPIATNIKKIQKLPKEQKINQDK